MTIDSPIRPVMYSQCFARPAELLGNDHDNA